MKPLYATLEDRMFGRAQRDMTDEEKKDLETYCDGHPLAKFARADIAWRDQMIRELRDALKFYADEKNYQQRGWQVDHPPSPLLSRGKRGKTKYRPDPSF